MRASKSKELPNTFVEALAASRHRAFNASQLAGVIHEAQQFWPFARRKSVSVVAEWLIDNTQLQRTVVRSAIRRNALNRFTWGAPSPYAIALSLTPRGYFSHGTALILNGLVDTRDNAPIYVNQEQTPKPPPSPATITQESVDRAFARPQRISNNVFRWDRRQSALIVNGKHTDRLEVCDLSTLDGGTAPATRLARTLIDVAVRPEYAGGPSDVLGAYVRANGRVSVPVLAEILAKLGYAYPYHQTIGFYLQRAGFDTEALAPLTALGFKVNFYVAYAMSAPCFDERWRVFYPADLDAS